MSHPHHGDPPHQQPDHAHDDAALDDAEQDDAVAAAVAASAAAPAAGSSDAQLVLDWHRIRSGVSRIQRRLDDAVEREGVPAAWFAVLHMLLAVPSGGLPMNVLARDLGMTSGGFTKLADRMARDGFIDRRGTTGDRRVVHATLTDAGYELGRRLDTLYVRALRETLLGGQRGDRLADAGQVLSEVADAQYDTMAYESGSSAEEPGMLATQRDPALPDRRERGRARE